MGLIIHHAMELWLADRTCDFVDLFEHTSFDEFRLKYNYPPGYKLEVERIQLRRIAREVSAAVHWPVESSEAEVECDFDFPGGVTVSVPSGLHRQPGAGNCIIVDYKSGKVANVDKLVESETSLQGPLYALAVREKKNLNTVAMVYIAVREGRTIGWGQIPGIDLELLPMPENWIDNARDRIVERLQSFLQGDVHAEPTTKDDCTWCDYRATCRIDEQTETVTIGVAGACTKLHLFENNWPRPTTYAKDARIVAGPGSGKTTVLVERYRRLVFEHNLEPRQILAITFTEKAAANMKAKLAEQFRHDPICRRDLESAPVSTIHGFLRAPAQRERHVPRSGRPALLRPGSSSDPDIPQQECLNRALDDLTTLRREETLELIEALNTPQIIGDLKDAYDAMRSAIRN